MEKQSYISARQAVLILLLTRLPYSTAFIADLHAGDSVQDILLSAPVNFLLNFIFAVPILALMRRHPGKDLLEIADHIGGRPLTAVLGALYLAYFLFQSLLSLECFQQFYINSIIPESQYLSIVIPLLLVSLYASVRGIEGMARCGVFVMVVYLLNVLIIGLTLIPSIHLEYVLPQFYNGPAVFEKALLSVANGNYQIVLLSFLGPFLRGSEKPARIFAWWNVIKAILLFLLQFLIVTVLGPFGAQQTFPVYSLSRQSGLGVFDRLEAVELVGWIVETLFELSVLIYMAYTCVVRAGVNRGRRLLNLGLGALLLVVGWLVSRHVYLLRGITRNPVVTASTILTVILIPLGLLLADTIREKAGQTS